MTFHAIFGFFALLRNYIGRLLSHLTNRAENLGKIHECLLFSISIFCPVFDRWLFLFCYMAVTTVDSGSKALEFLGLHENDPNTPFVSPNGHQVWFLFFFFFRFSKQ